MNHAHIIPMSLAKTADKLNDMHLLLVHWGMEHKGYVDFYANSKVYKILDNSFYELKRALPIKDIIEYAELMNVQEVVAPDQMYNYKFTKSMVNQFIKDLKATGKRDNYKVQAVVCGKTEKEIIQCYEDFLNNPDIDVVAFSRRGQVFPNECHDDARFRIVCECLDKFGNRKPIHLLGANGISEYYRKWPKEIRSMDSKQFATAAIGKWDLDTKVTPQQAKAFKMMIEQLKQ